LPVDSTGAPKAHRKTKDVRREACAGRMVGSAKDYGRTKPGREGAAGGGGSLSAARGPPPPPPPPRPGRPSVSGAPHLLRGTIVPAPHTRTSQSIDNYKEKTYNNKAQQRHKQAPRVAIRGRTGVKPGGQTPGADDGRKRSGPPGSQGPERRCSSWPASLPTSPPIVGGSAIALLWLLSSDLGATQCGAPSKPQPMTWNGRSGMWRHNFSVRMACPTAKILRIKLTRPSPRLVYHCNDAISRIQDGPRPWCTQARSLSARNGEDSRRPASPHCGDSIQISEGL